MSWPLLPELGPRVEAVAQGTRPLRVVSDHAVVVELDAGLHDETDHPLPCCGEPVTHEGLTVRSERRERRLRLRYRKLLQALLRTAGHRHLGADDVDGRLTA